MARKTKDVNIFVYNSITNEKLLNDELKGKLPENNNMRVLKPALRSYLKNNVFIGEVKDRYVVIENINNIQDVLAFDVFTKDNKLHLKQRKVIPNEKVKMVSGAIKICMPISDLQKLKEFDKEIEEQYSKLVLNTLRAIEVPNESKVVHRLALDETTHNPQYGL